MKFHFKLKSGNGKTGPIPVTTTSAATCPDACPFKGEGCYAEGGKLFIHWREVTEGRRGDDWETFLGKIDTIEPGALWRMNQAGDLPGENDSLDVAMLAQLVDANDGRSGFTYTHKPLHTAAERAAVAAANAAGFTVNLSANNPAHADALADLNIGPVVVVLPSDTSSNTTTPAGRRIVLCPATQRDDVTCMSCRACANAERTAIIGFPAHGASKRRASIIAIKKV